MTILARGLCARLASVTAFALALIFSASAVHAQEATTPPGQSPVSVSFSSAAFSSPAFSNGADAAPESAFAPQPPAHIMPGTLPQNVPANASDRLTFDRRFKIYAHGLVSIGSIAGPLIGAGIGQWSNSPEEWGQGSTGFGRRIASAYARSTINQTIVFGVAALDHEDPRFTPSGESTVMRRLTHTVVGTFYTRTDTGDGIPAYSRFAGAFGASAIANAWYPESKRTVGATLSRGATTMLSRVLYRVILEFSPNIRSVLRRPDKH